MKRKILLPRKDHEVYFIAPPEGMKRRNIPTYIEDVLYERHPGFSPAAACDFRRVSVNGRHWIMATVMEHETLAGYRLGHPRAMLFTATGVLIRRPGFLHAGMTVLPDETIGYDGRNNEPVSLPVTEADKPAADISALLGKTPSRYRVFKTRRPFLRYALLLIPLLAAGGVVLSRYRVSPPEELITAEPEVIEPVPVIKPDIPDPLMILTELAGAIRRTRGVIDLWRYDETAEPVLTVQLSGPEADILYNMITVFPYVIVNDISDITYIGNKPHYTVRLSHNTGVCHVPELRGFAAQETALSLFSLLRERFSPLRVTVTSETPPPAGTGSAAVTLEAEGRDFIRALEAIQEVFNEHELGIRAMTVSLDRPRGVFMFSVSFEPYRDRLTPRSMYGDAVPGDVIPAAFGYIEKKPPEVIVVPPEPEPEPPSYTAIGIIREEEYAAMTYYKNPEGKMLIQEEQGP